MRKPGRTHSTRESRTERDELAASREVRFDKREREYVFSVTMKYLKDEEEAADATQDAMLLAYRHRASFRGDSRFTTWLYRVAATTALMHLRKKRRAGRTVPVEQDVAGEPLVAEVAAPTSSPEEEAAAVEAIALANESLERMGEKYGPIFRMRFADGYSEQEIAKKLKLNVATVKTRAYRARAAVRADLEAQLA
jgi:RNA polymerase sigma-70 factor, ECF subfamily